MPFAELPAIDQKTRSFWTEQEKNAYNTMPFYFVKKQIRRRQLWSTWPKLCGRMKWQPNQGDTVKSVRKEPSPVTRQVAYPTRLSDPAMRDTLDVREVTNTGYISHHKFESPVFQFYASYRDFMTDHVSVHSKDIMDKQAIYEDVYARTAIWHNSPNVMIVDRPAGSFIGAPVGMGNVDGTAAKTTAWIQEQLANIGEPGNLSMIAINSAVTAMANDLRVPPFTGANNNEDISKAGIMEKYILITSAEAYNQFLFDPYVQANRSINLNIITAGFVGDLWGQVRCRLEAYPMRFAADGTLPPPEIRITGVQNERSADENVPYNVGETVPNPDYVNAPFEVAWMVGEVAYDLMPVGAPPKDFAGNGMPNGFGEMSWNGEIIMNKALVTPYMDKDNVLRYEFNNYGEYLQLLSHVTYGILPQQRRYVMPIVFRRRRGPTKAY